jgi:hypothetical protein
MEAYAMHQQVRVGLSAASTSDTPGAMPATEVEVTPYEVPTRALLRLLKLLAGEGYNIRAASGHFIESGGVFVFAVEDDDDPGLPQTIADFLKGKNYKKVDVVQPFHADVRDEVGALAAAVEEATKDGSIVQEILVGLPGDEGVPLQITTLRHGSAQGV